MKTSLPNSFIETADGKRAEDILRRCVHCGFCNATCPTYQELNDERDGPRGRIYLIKQMLENDQATVRTRVHLDRCLTCRSCETTCPSGVQYSQLLDIGRKHIQRHAPRSFKEMVTRYSVTRFVPHPFWNRLLVTTSRLLYPILPSSLRKHVPAKQKLTSYSSGRNTKRVMIAFRGCIQQTVTPNTVQAAKAVMSHLGIDLVEAKQENCCGAINHHLSEHERAIVQAKRNIDAWWPLLETGAEAIVISASGCGVAIREYPMLLGDSDSYRDKANIVAQKAKDLSEVLLNEDLSNLPLKPSSERFAIHCPCTLQHGLKIKNQYFSVLSCLGIEQTKTSEDHLCCGSAGTYSIFQPTLSQQLLDRKIAALSGDLPEGIVTANIGCQLHLNSKAQVPVKHWIEVIAERLEE